MTTYILSGPQGIGKTRHKARLAAALKVSTVVEDCTTAPPSDADQLVITNTAISAPPGSVMFDVEDEAGLAALISLLERPAC
jgi:hypothetical protein